MATGATAIAIAVKNAAASFFISYFLLITQPCVIIAPTPPGRPAFDFLARQITHHLPRQR
jgi:hypothetical protein